MDVWAFLRKDIDKSGSIQLPQIIIYDPFHGGALMFFSKIEAFIP